MRKLLLILGILGFLVLSLTAAAEKLVFVTEPYPPYEYLENGQFVGIDVDIIRAVCTRLGVESEFREVPWARALFEVENGLADGIFSLMYTEERAKFLEYPAENLSFEKNIALTHKGSGLKVGKLEDLQGKTVGVVAEYSYGPEFDAYQGLQKQESKDSEQLLRKLAARRMDVAILNELVTKFLMKQLGLQEQIEFLEYATSNDPLYVAFSKASKQDSKALAEQFTKVLKELKQEGIIQQIMEKY